MEEKLLEAEPHYRQQLVPLDPLREVEAKHLAFEKAKEFHFFRTEISVLQQTYDIPEGSLFQILEHRFNIRREEAEIDGRLRALKDTLLLLEERQGEQEGRLRREEQELEALEAWLKQAESDLEVEVRIRQGQVELGGERPVPEL
jgi:hypothetical protein